MSPEVSPEVVGPEDSPQLIAIGETMAVVAPARVEPLDTAEVFRVDAGGAESNVAAHAAALGLTTAWVSALGDDPLGRRIRTTVAGRGVDTRWVTTDPHAPTGVYFKDPGQTVYYYRTGSAASGMSPDTIAEVPLERAQIVHISGITAGLSDSCAGLLDAVISRLTGTGTRLSFDVNYRPTLWPVDRAAPRLLALAHRCDFVLVGRDEAETLWGTATARAIRDLLPDVPHLVIKDAEVGAHEFSSGDPVFVPAVRTQVVEPVGAGDAFAAGYLAGVIRGLPAAERLQAGHDRAVLALGSTGDFPERTT